MTEIIDIKAREILDSWEEEISTFVKVYPRDYRRVMEEKEGKNG